MIYHDSVFFVLFNIYSYGSWSHIFLSCTLQLLNWFNSITYAFLCRLTLISTWRTPWIFNFFRIFCVIKWVHQASMWPRTRGRKVPRLHITRSNFLCRRWIVCSCHILIIILSVTLWRFIVIRFPYFGRYPSSLVYNTAFIGKWYTFSGRRLLWLFSINSVHVEMR